MSFYNILNKYKKFDILKYIDSVSRNDVLDVLSKDNLDEFDFLKLLSKNARDKDIFELIAIKSNDITKRYFGKTISIFTPLYLSNICENGCLYCGFSRDNSIKRKKLSYSEIEKEAIAIKDSGISHVIILTGDSKASTPPSYIAKAAQIIKKYINSISIEVYSLDEDEYKLLFDCGVDGFTMFQETYNETLYSKLHPIGPKHDFLKRLNSPELACRASYHNVNIGALLGLDDFRVDSFYTYLHLKYLMDKYSGTDFSVSLPRIRPTKGNNSFKVHSIVSDIDIVQSIFAYRLSLNRVGITISSRESEMFRNNLIGLGVTKMSAASITEVGGHSSKSKTEGQFEICDSRTLNQMEIDIKNKGHQVVLKDWEIINNE